MAKFTKSVEKKSADKVLVKSAGGVQKKNGQNKPAVAPAASKPNAAVKAAIIAEAKTPKPVKAAAASSAKPTDKAAKPKAYSIFVGNLPTNTKRKTLISLFKSVGTAQAIRFRRSNGGKLQKTDLASQTSIIAFVDFATAAEARAGAAALNNHKMGTNVLRVDVQAGSKNAATTDAKRTAFVGNLAYNTTDDQLRKTFADCGKIDYVRVNQSKKGCNGTAFVCFKDAASVVAALKLNGRDVNGRPVRINRSEKKQTEVAAKRPVEESADEAAEEEADSDKDDEDEDESEDEETVPVVPVKKAAAKPKVAAASKPKIAAAAGNKNKKGGKKNSA